MDFKNAFGQLGKVTAGSSTSYLKPYTINEGVTIKSTAVTTGNKDGREWKKLDIVLGNDEGVYNDSVFYVDDQNPDTFNRGTTQGSNGGERQLPSRWEQFMYHISALGFAFAPEAFEKLQKLVNSGKVKNVEELMTGFKKVLDGAIGKNPTSMKLVGRNYNGRLYANLPSMVGIAQAKTADVAASNGVEIDDWYTWLVNPFGDNLSFSAYEEGQRKKVTSAKPTPMPDSNPDEVSGAQPSEEDWASMLAD